MGCKKTIIMVTHSNEASSYSSRIIKIKDGMVDME
jgi:ABC-type lipoprotein export system ATPase subunit